MFRATEVEKKKNKRNKPTYRPAEINLSRDCHPDSLGTKNVSSTHVQNFWKINKSLRQKRCGIVYILLK